MERKEQLKQAERLSSDVLDLVCDNKELLEQLPKELSRALFDCIETMDNFINVHYHAEIMERFFENSMYFGGKK